MRRFEDMQTFVRVVDAGSISAAAEQLGVAKSAVSRRLSELEARLGVQLLRRTTRRLNLTDSGRGFYDRCRRILADLEEAEAAVSQAHATLRGRLRVAAPLSFGLRHLGPAITEFMREHPQVDFDLDFNDRQVDLLAEDIDVAIRIARLEDSSLIARQLAPSRRVLCAAPAYLARHGAPLGLDDLARHECLRYAYQTSGERWRFHGPGGERHARIGGRLRVNNGDALLQAAIGGLGIALLPSFICGESLRAGLLAQLLPEWNERSDADVYAVYPASRNLSLKVRAFVDFLAERFSPAPYWDAGLSA